MKTKNLSFGEALEFLKKGQIISRRGWIGSGIYVFMQVPSEIELEMVPKMSSLPQSVKDMLQKRFDSFHNESNVELKNSKRHYVSINYKDQLAMLHYDNSITGLSINTTDLLANDWCALD